MKPIFYTIEKSNGQTEDIAVFNYDDGTTLSMPKAVYDTLASELSNPSTPQAGE